MSTFCRAAVALCVLALGVLAWGVLALLVPAQADAQARQSVWSSTLTVDENPFGSGCNNAGGSQLADCTDGLSPDGFSYDGTAYKVVDLQNIINGGTFHIKLDKAIPSKIRSTGKLTAGDTVLSFSDATFSDQNKQADWVNPGLPAWTDNQQVSLSLTVSANTVSFSSASPNPVDEGGAVNVYLSMTPVPSSQVVIPVTVTPASSEPEDHATISSITISHHDGTGAAQINIHQDDDAEHEVFIVAFGALPSGIVAGSPSSLSITIIDDEANPAPPSAPANLNAEAGDGQVTLRWTKVPGARWYRYRAWEGTGDDARPVSNWEVLADYGDDETGVVTGLDNGTTYTFRVHAMMRGPATRWIQWVSGADSNPVTATPGSPPPARCSAALTGDGSVSGRWSGRYEFGGGWVPNCFSVKRGANYDAWYYTFTLAERSEVTLYLQSADAGTHLYLWDGHNRKGGTPLAEHSGPFWRRGTGFSSRIVSTLDAGPYTVEATTYAELDDGHFTLSVDGLVSPMTVTHNGTSLAVSWWTPPGATRYDVTYSDNGARSWAQAAQNITDASLNIRCDTRPDHVGQSCVHSAGTYIVSVRARDSDGNIIRDWWNSAPVSYTPPPEPAVRDTQPTRNSEQPATTTEATAEPPADPGPPATPTNLQAEDDFGAIALTWNAVDGATGYQYRFSYQNPAEDGTAFDWPSGTTGDVTETSHTVHFPGYPGQWWYFEVRAVRTSGGETVYGEWSGTIRYWW